jgi:hypothetical protein
MLTAAQAMPRKTRYLVAFSSPYEAGERSMNAGRVEKEERTSEDRDRMARGTESDRVG